MIDERKNLISTRYFKNDGLSSFRVCKVVCELLKSDHKNYSENNNYEFNFKQYAREFLGFKTFHF